MNLNWPLSGRVFGLSSQSWHERESPLPASEFYQNISLADGIQIYVRENENSVSTGARLMVRRSQKKM